MTTKIHLRKKPISKGRVSLYLDFYPAITEPDSGKLTRREFLGIYLIEKPKNPFDKTSNKELQELAENIRAKRQLEIQSGDFGFLKSKKNEIDFIDFLKALAESKTGSNKAGWFTMLNYFIAFAGETLKASEVSENLCNDFRDFLKVAKKQKSLEGIKINPNTAKGYFNKFKAALKQGYKKGLFDSDLSQLMDAISGQEVQREHLTIPELQKLVNTNCTMPLLKNAALFSALTGLRFSDIEKLTWNEVYFEEGQGYFLRFRQQKTKGAEVLPISEQAFNLLGERGEVSARVFEGLKYSAYTNIHLTKWIAKAGITKDITFHCFRHTFATLQLSAGTDLYTVSKMLGHREIKTTQIYAKIVDLTKRKAADQIKLDF